MFASAFSCEIEFVGGPLDGHVEMMGLPLRAFVGVHMISDAAPISWLHAILKKWRVKPDKHVLLSIYELGSTRRRRICYRFVRYQAVSEQSISSDGTIDAYACRTE